MSDLDAVLRLRAWIDGRPLPLRDTAPWPRLAPADVLVVAFVRMAGETAPWAVAWGPAGGEPRVEAVPDPRRADDVRAMVMRFGDELLAWCGHPSKGDARDLARAALVVPGASHGEVFHLLEYRYARAVKVPDAERPRVNAFGRLCGWIFRESQRPAQTLVVDATKSIREAWAVPAEDVRQQHLGFVHAWLTTDGDRDARFAAAERAEADAVGITLDPTFERDTLEPIVSAWNAARQKGHDDVARADEIRAAVGEEVRRRWRLADAAWSTMQRDARPTSGAFDELAALAQDEYEWQWRRAEVKREAGEEVFVPDPETDRQSAAAASRFFAHQRAEEVGAVATLHADPGLVRRAALEGKALRGVITKVCDEGVGRKTVPVWTMETAADVPTRFREGGSAEVAGQRGRSVVIRRVTVRGDVREVELEVRGQKTGRGGHGDPCDPSLRGTTVALIDAGMPELTRQKSLKAWSDDGPGAWLTHGQSDPPHDRATRRQEDLVDYVEALGAHR
ncbi:MAG: hypothetical protein U0324_39805 [Polyangiales bacterium]